LALSKSGSVEVFNFLSARFTSSRKRHKINYWRCIWQLTWGFATLFIKAKMLRKRGAFSKDFEK
jgi:hypothetical protein